MIFGPLPSPSHDIAQNNKIGAVWFDYLRGIDRFVRAQLSAATTVSSLPSASSVGAGARAFVTDATATTFHSTVVGGGTNKVPVVSDGTDWLIG